MDRQTQRDRQTDVERQRNKQKQRYREIQTGRYTVERDSQKQIQTDRQSDSETDRFIQLIWSVGPFVSDIRASTECSGCVQTLAWFHSVAQCLWICLVKGE